MTKLPSDEAMKIHIMARSLILAWNSWNKDTAEHATARDKILDDFVRDILALDEKQEEIDRLKQMISDHGSATYARLYHDELDVNEKLQKENEELKEKFRVYGGIKIFNQIKQLQKDKEELVAEIERLKLRNSNLSKCECNPLDNVYKNKMEADRLEKDKEELVLGVEKIMSLAYELNVHSDKLLHEIATTAEGILGRVK